MKLPDIVIKKLIEKIRIESILCYPDVGDSDINQAIECVFENLDKILTEALEEKCQNINGQGWHEAEVRRTFRCPSCSGGYGWKEVSGYPESRGDVSIHCFTCSYVDYL
jgi:hypothetical protein